MRMRSCCLVLIAILGICGETQAAGAEQSLVWYDGNQPREVFVDSTLIAQFDADRETPVLPAAAAVRAQPQAAIAGGVRLWRLTDKTRPEVAAPRLNGVAARHSYSPVLRDHPMSPRLRSLPGNIIVYLDPSWDAVRVARWLGEHKLEAIRTLPVRRNAYVIKTAPGLVALQTANALYRSGEVVAAFPDWWQTVVTR